MLQFQISQELPGSSQPYQVGYEQRKQAKPVVPETSKTRTGKVCWGETAGVSEAHQSSLSKTGNRQGTAVR